MVKINEEQKKALALKEQAKNQARIKALNEKEEQIAKSNSKNQPKEDSVNIILKSNFRGFNFHNRGVKSLGRDAGVKEQQTELQRLSKRNLTPNFIDPAPKFAQSEAIQEPKMKHPGMPFLKKKPD